MRRSASITGGKSISPLAEHQVLVDPGPHVLDVDVHEVVGVGDDLLGDRRLAVAMKVADINR